MKSPPEFPPSGPALFTFYQAPENLSATLALDADGHNRCVILNPGRSVLGGHYAAHCIMAATAPPETREPLSLHMLFVDRAEPVRHYRVEAESLRQGRQFGHRKVRVTQQDRLLVDARLTLRMAGAGASQPSWPERSPELAMPDQMAPRAELPVDGWLGNSMIRGLPFVEIRIPPGFRPGHRLDAGDRARYWLRVPASRGFSSREHHALLALVSDYWFSLPVHAISGEQQPPQFLTSSLDHAIWFHRPPDCGEWLLAETEAWGVHDGVAMMRALYWNLDGELVATAVQQTLIRD